MSSQPARIGIELEFMVAHLGTGLKKVSTSTDTRWPDDPDNRHTTDDIFQADQACLTRVCEVIASCGLPVSCAFDLTLRDNDPVNAAEEGDHYLDPISGKYVQIWNVEMMPDGPEPSQFRSWYVNHEPHITLDVYDSSPRGMPSGYSWYAMEINSPILSTDEEFDAQLPTLRAVIRALRNNLKIWTSADCGLHIHASPVGQPRDKTFIKKVAALVCLLEDNFLLGLCHPSRRGSYYTQKISTASQIATGGWGYSKEEDADAPFWEALRHFRQEAKGLRADEPRMYKLLYNIFTQVSVESLQRGLRMPRTNIGAADTDGGKAGLSVSDFGTIEFRYFEGSTVPEFAAFWVDVVQKIFAMAMLSTDKYCEKLCVLYELTMKDKAQDWRIWLDFLGLSHWETFCHDRLQKYKGPLKNLNKTGIQKPVVGPWGFE